jgi:bacterioferritin
MRDANGSENIFLAAVRAVDEDAQDGLHAFKAAERAGSGGEASIDLLQGALAAEIVCVVRYSLLAISEEGLKNEWFATEMQAQANDERRHMAMLSERIEQLGGVPEFNPKGLQDRISGLSRCAETLTEQLRQNLAAEQCLVDHYQKLLTYFDRHDPETASMLMDILQDEENHRADMQDLLQSGLG